MKKRDRKEVKANIIAISLIFAILVSLVPAVFATPTGPDELTSISNETRATTSARQINLSGGYIATFNLTATVQNTKWKAFVGNVTGQYTLDDASGSTIYDWTLASVGGEVYATRASGAINWGTTNCATGTDIDSEDSVMHHTNEDNISSTFSGTNTKTFVVAGTTIAAANCSATNTYVNNVSQALEFEEVVLYDQTNIIYATVLEPDETGFDGNLYDFQMIVPENGSETWAGTTAYYIYVELS